MNTSNRASSRSFGAAIIFAAFFAGVLRTGTNLWHAILVLTRAPRAKPPRVRAGTLAAVAVTIAAIVASMFFLDAAASNWARHLPQWVTDPAEEITNFGLSGRFLYPLGFIVLILAALIGPWLPRMTQGVLDVANGTLRLSVYCNWAAEPVRHHCQASDRAGAPLRRPAR